MADDADVIVELEPEAKPTGDAAVTELTTQFKELQAQSEKDKQAREDAERRASAARQEADQARREVTTARTEVADSQVNAIATGLEAAKTESQMAEAAYKAAFDAGDVTAMAAAQRQIARAESKLIRLEEAKADLDARKVRQPTEAEQVRTAPADPVEAYISGRTEPTQRWLREHKEWITDSRKNAKLTAAHHDAVADGLSPDTQAYFDHVEKFIGLKQAEPEVKPKPAAKRAETAPVAPAQASSGGTNGGGQVVKLSPHEVRAATDGTVVWNWDDPKGKFKRGDPVGTQEFARRKAEMTKQGHYDRTYLEQ